MHVVTTNLVKVDWNFNIRFSIFWAVIYSFPWLLEFLQILFFLQIQ